MGFLKVDYSNTGDFAPLPIGEYECMISKAEVKPTQAGEPMIKMELTIREDVDQKGKKRKIFDNLLIRDTMMWKLNQVAKAAGLSEEEAAGFDTPEEFATGILYRMVRIANKHEVYEGHTNDKVKFYKVSEHGGGDGGRVDGDPFSGGGSIDISDEDLPF
jgi:hypothetical protein